MLRRILPLVGFLAFGFALSGCANDNGPGAGPIAAPPGNARLDSGISQTGNSSMPLGGGQAAVGSRPQGSITRPMEPVMPAPAPAQ